MYISHLEWESFEWPIRISNINCSDTGDNLPPNSVIEIQRDGLYKLKAVITGTREMQKHSNGENGEHGFIRGYEIYGYDQHHIPYIIHGVVLRNVSLTSSKKNGKICEHFTHEMHIDGIELVYGDNKPSTHLEFFLSHQLQNDFSRRTKRERSGETTKSRELNSSEQVTFTLNNNPSGSATDHIYVKTPNFGFVVQRVSKEYQLDFSDGFLIEYSQQYKSIPDEKTRKIIGEIVGFILGTHPLKIGSTSLNQESLIIKATAQNPWGDSYSQDYKNSVTPPVMTIGTLHNSNFEEVMNEIVNKALPIYDDLKISGILWKYWIAASNPVGTDLPILASGLENLATNYLGINSISRKYSKEEKSEYNKLVKTHLEILESTLEGHELKDRVLNRIRTPFNLSIGELLRLFFSSIDIEFDNKSIEKRAMNSRNKMTHGTVVNDQTGYDELIEITRMSNAYRSLFNRSLLRVIGFEGKYIDYYSERITERELNENIANDKD